MEVRMSIATVLLWLRRLAVPVTLTALGAGCSDDACEAGNPLMPVCFGAADTPGPAEPAVVFQSNRDGNVMEIFTMNSDGTGARRLTHNPGQDIMPRWSPDGSKIVFASNRGSPARELYVMNADGTDQRRLTNLGTNPGFPDWSPDGSEIVFNAARGDGNFDIHVMNADGSNIRRLTYQDSQLRPRWSPDGRMIALTWYQGTAAGTCCAKVAVMNADGTNLRILTDQGMQDQEPDWSPDSRQLAFSRWMGFAGGGMLGTAYVAVIDVDGSGERLLGMNTVGALAVSWSRTTNRIYFNSAISGYQQVYSVRSDGGDLRRVSLIGVASDQNPHVR
jgi:Tol biopolymer transport system component